MPDLTTRVAVVTGANSGLGRVSALALAGHGATVVLACRDASRGAAARHEVAAAATAAPPLLVGLDLSDTPSVAVAAAEIAAIVPRIDILMNNAGVMAIPLRRTADGFETQFATNHLGHFALTARLLPLLLAAPAPRVVTTTSTVHRVGRLDLADLNSRQRYRPWRAYAQSKLANLLFAFELDRRARVHHQPVISVAAHPGYAATHLQAVGPELSGNRVLLGGTHLANRLFAQPAEIGALPQLYAATARDVEGGAVYGPDGLFESRGYPRRVGASARAHDEVSARRLWDLSEELCGVSFAWPEGPSAQRE
jgi:NAD(P)-dependent dehydrogenase (short-subunit alcohol dehydrogenase family)